MSDVFSSGDENINEKVGTSSKPGMGWLLPLLLLVLTAGLVLYFVKGNNSYTVGILPAVDTTAEVFQGDTVVHEKPTLSIRLIDGTELMAFQNGVEKMLLIYLNSKEAADSISKNRWFDFDNLNFETSSSKITDSSINQVKNIAAILKAYPKLKIKIGGYTDKTGNEAANLKLSQARADAVVAALKKAGANAEQIVGAEGYGSQYAKAAANAPDEEKQKDRRISINVRAK
ncbi:MAG TPA: OmpA family protein [Panacibacter sp.]|nr:OmpA family protein [Panacibacter sp.]